MFMSGGSRGIGLAIAIKAARDGAKVALMANRRAASKLPGTVFTEPRRSKRRRRGAADRGRHPRADASAAAAQTAERFAASTWRQQRSAIHLSPMRDAGKRFP